MEEAQTKDSTQEVVSPAAEIQEEVPQHQVAEEQGQPVQDTPDWVKELRKGHKQALREAEQLRRENAMKDEMLNRLLASQQNGAPQQASMPAEDFISSLAKEEYVAGEKVAQGFNHLKSEFRRELDEVKKSYAQQQQASLINDLRREYADFDDVVNSETLHLLETTNPKLAQAIGSTKDPYSIAVQSYEYIKAKGLASNSDASRRSQETQRKIEQNKKTVQSPQAFDKRPLAAAFKMTDSMKKELREEMEHYSRQAGGY